MSALPAFIFLGIYAPVGNLLVKERESSPNVQEQKVAGGQGSNLGFVSGGRDFTLNILHLRQGKHEVFGVL